MMTRPRAMIQLNPQQDIPSKETLYQMTRLATSSAGTPPPGPGIVTIIWGMISRVIWYAVIPREVDITKPSKDDRWETVYSNPPSQQKNMLFLKKEHVLSTVQQLIDIGERQINIQIIV